MDSHLIILISKAANHDRLIGTALCDHLHHVGLVIMRDSFDRELTTIALSYGAMLRRDMRYGASNKQNEMIISLSY